MGRMIKLILWEMNNPLVVLVLLIGLVLGFAAVHQSYLSAVSSEGEHYFTGGNALQTTSYMAGESDYPYTPTAEAIRGSIKAGFGIYAFIIIIMGSLIFRWDRDSGYAPTVYSLPYSKFKIFIAKSAAFLTLSLILYILPYLLAIIPSNADILHIVSIILRSREVLSGLTLLIYAVLYTASVTALLGSFLRGLFPTLIGAFFVVSLSSSLFPSSLPPFSFLMYTVYPGVSPFEARFVVPGLILPLLFLLLGAFIFERRDVM